MIEVTIERTGELEELANGKFKEIVEEAMMRTALDTQKKCMQEAPNDTGNLQASIHPKHIRPDGFELWGEHYWKYINAGSKAHIIEAKNKKVLADKAKGIVFGKRVQHPGTPANPFVTRTAKEVPRFFRRNLKELGGL